MLTHFEPNSAIVIFFRSLVCFGCFFCFSDERNFRAEFFCLFPSFALVLVINLCCMKKKVSRCVRSLYFVVVCRAKDDLFFCVLEMCKVVNWNEILIQIWGCVEPLQTFRCHLLKLLRAPNHREKPREHHKLKTHHPIPEYDGILFCLSEIVDIFQSWCRRARDENMKWFHRKFSK